MASDLAGGSHVANIYEFGTRLYVASGSETRYRVNLSRAWGSNDFLTNPAPLTSAYQPPSGSDGPLVVRDRANSYEFWQYAWNAGSPRASWGAVLPLSGNGSSAKAPTGAGISHLAGIVTQAEFVAGQINHALIFSSDNSCGSHRFPAAKTDGESSASNCIPEGARVQLDPAVDISALPAKDRAVARALQVYGAYDEDNGGAKMAFTFETPHGGASDPYAAEGWSDYHGINLPWSRLRVLASATGR